METRLSKLKRKLERDPEEEEEAHEFEGDPSTTSTDDGLTDHTPKRFRPDRRSRRVGLSADSFKRILSLESDQDIDGTVDENTDEAVDESVEENADEFDDESLDESAGQTSDGSIYNAIDDNSEEISDEYDDPIEESLEDVSVESSAETTEEIIGGTDGEAAGQDIEEIVDETIDDCIPEEDFELPGLPELEKLHDQKFPGVDGVPPDSQQGEDGNNPSQTILEAQGLPQEMTLVEALCYDRIVAICRILCDYALKRENWQSGNPFAYKSWLLFRRSQPEALASIVYCQLTDPARLCFGAEELDPLLLLDIAEPDRKDIGDTSNSAGVYGYVCHKPIAELASVDLETVSCYTGQGLRKPVEDGRRQGMALRFDDHAREMKKPMSELEEEAAKASVSVPLFYKTVIEEELEVRPRVVATLPRNGFMPAKAMVIETVVMFLMGSVSAESSHGLPTQGLVESVSSLLRPSMKYVPKPLNRALPIWQGYVSAKRVYRKCDDCENDSKTFSLGFFTSQFDMRCLCRSCLRKEMTIKTREVLREMTMERTIRLPAHRSICENPDCKSKRNSAFGWSVTVEDRVLCQSCRYKDDAWKQRELAGKNAAASQPTQIRACSSAQCEDPYQKTRNPRWARSHIFLAQELVKSGLMKGKKATEKVNDLKLKNIDPLTGKGGTRAGTPIPESKRYCHDLKCPRKNKWIPKGKKWARWSKDPAREGWVLCKGCFWREDKRLLRQDAIANGREVDYRGDKIDDEEKWCTEPNCPDPTQAEKRANATSATGAAKGKKAKAKDKRLRFWHRHPTELNGRVVCSSCRKAILQKQNTAANRVAREKVGNPVRKRGGQKESPEEEPADKAVELETDD